MSGTTPEVAESTGRCSCSSARAEGVDVCGDVVRQVGLLSRVREDERGRGCLQPAWGSGSVLERGLCNGRAPTRWGV